MLQIFISHSWEDNNLSRKIAADLRRDGADVWIDYTRIEGGQNLPDVIGKAIESRDILVLVWSDYAAESYYVKMEWSCALSLKKRIIPCILDKRRLPAILSSLLYHDFQMYDEGYKNLAHDLRLQPATKYANDKSEEASDKIHILPKEARHALKYRDVPFHYWIYREMRQKK